MEIVQWIQRTRFFHSSFKRKWRQKWKITVCYYHFFNAVNGAGSQDADRTQKCAIVFDDWDVVNALGVKDRVDLGGLFFGG